MYRIVVFCRLLKQLETGVSDRLLRRWRLAKPQCSLSLSTSMFNVNLSDINTILWFLAAGMGVSVIILAIEISHNIVKKKKKLTMSK